MKGSPVHIHGSFDLIILLSVDDKCIIKQRTGFSVDLRFTLHLCKVITAADACFQKISAFFISDATEILHLISPFLFLFYILKYLAEVGNAVQFFYFFDAVLHEVLDLLRIVVILVSDQVAER